MKKIIVIARLVMALALMFWVHLFMYWCFYEMIHGHAWTYDIMDIESWLFYISSLITLLAWVLIIVPLPKDSTDIDE